jgi:hypothetical protein
MLTRRKPLDFSNLSFAVNRKPTTKIFDCVITSQAHLTRPIYFKYVCALFVNIPLNLVRIAMRSRLFQIIVEKASLDVVTPCKGLILPENLITLQYMTLHCMSHKTVHIN